MAKITSKDRTWAAYFSLVLFGVGCGGKTSDDTYVAGDGTTSTPPPTCEQICRHVVDACFPGAGIEPCVRDCETTVTEYTGCKALDPFLRCNARARVLCTDMAVIDDCYVERNELTRCKS